MQKRISPPQPPQPVNLSPGQTKVINFISGINPDDLHEVTTAALFLLADSEMVDGKRWIMVRLVECFHLLSMEK